MAVCHDLPIEPILEPRELQKHRIVFFIIMIFALSESSI